MAARFPVYLGILLATCLQAAHLDTLELLDGTRLQSVTVLDATATHVRLNTSQGTLKVPRPLMPRLILEIPLRDALQGPVETDLASNAGLANWFQSAKTRVPEQLLPLVNALHTQFLTLLLTGNELQRLPQVEITPQRIEQWKNLDYMQVSTTGGQFSPQPVLVEAFSALVQKSSLEQVYRLLEQFDLLGITCVGLNTHPQYGVLFSPSPSINGVPSFLSVRTTEVLIVPSPIARIQNDFNADPWRFLAHYAPQAGLKVPLRGTNTHGVIQIPEPKGLQRLCLYGAALASPENAPLYLNMGAGPANRDAQTQQQLSPALWVCIQTRDRFTPKKPFQNEMPHVVR